MVRSMDIDGLARDDALVPGGANVKPVAPSVAGVKAGIWENRSTGQ